jgi:hypothetical protein
MLVHPILFYATMSSPTENRADSNFIRVVAGQVRGILSLQPLKQFCFILNQHYHSVRAWEANLRRRWNDGTTCNCHLVQVNLVSHERAPVPVVQPTAFVPISLVTSQVVRET